MTYIKFPIIDIEKESVKDWYEQSEDLAFYRFDLEFSETSNHKIINCTFTEKEGISSNHVDWFYLGQATARFR